MSDFINTIDVLGDEVVCAKMIDGTLTEFKDNVITSMRDNAFNTCGELTVIDLPSLTSIRGTSFGDCTKLKALILRSPTMCTLEYTSYAGPAYIYVPATLIESYKVDNMWKSGSSKFRALEDYTVDGTITGELDESKI